MRVEEPDPGGVFTESERALLDGDDLGGGPQGPGCRVRLETRWQDGRGRRVGRAAVGPRLLRQLYAEELERLDRYARTVPPA